MAVNCQASNDSFSREPSRERDEPGMRWRRDHETPLQYVEPERLIDPGRADSEAMMEDTIRETDQFLQHIGVRWPVRVVVILLLAGWTVRETAERLGISIYVVRRRLAAARKLLLQADAVESAPFLRSASAGPESEPTTAAAPIFAPGKPGHQNRSHYYRRSTAPESGGVHRWAGPGPDGRGKEQHGSQDEDRRSQTRSRAPLYSPHPARWTVLVRERGIHAPLLVCPCCEARLRPLTPAQSFGWRQVYDSETHR